MSLPNIPNITPTISLKRCETIELLLSSIALEEIGLSHIMNAEGEKLQSFLKHCPRDINDYTRINESINKTLRTIVKSQIMLQFKLEEVRELDCHQCCGDREYEKCNSAKIKSRKFCACHHDFDDCEEE